MGWPPGGAAESALLSHHRPPTEREEPGLSFKEPTHMKWQQRQSGPELSPRAYAVFSLLQTTAAICIRTL